MTSFNSIKKMIYSACHRGTKENDLLLGEFAKNTLEALTPAEQHLFERLLEEPDGDIYQWILTSQHLLKNKQDTLSLSTIPPLYGDLIQKIIKYHDHS